MFLSCGNACIANYRRFSSECSNAETRVQTQWGGEGLVRHRQSAAKHQRSTWKPTALPRPSVSLRTRRHCHRGTQNPEHKHWTRPRASCCCRSKRRSGEKEKEAAGRKMGGGGVRKWRGEEEEESRGDGGRGLPQHYKHQTWQREEQWSSEPNKTSPNLNQNVVAWQFPVIRRSAGHLVYTHGED